MKKLRSLRLPHWTKLLLALVALLCVPMGAVQASGTTTLVSPATTQVVIGNKTTVDIRVENVSDLFGVEVHLTFDPALLEVEDADGGQAGVQISSGPFLNPFFTAQNTVDPATGKIDFSISQGPSDAAASGSGVVATITFKGKAVGTSALSFTSVVLAAPGGVPITSAKQGGSVTVAPDVTATPTPTSTPQPTSTPGPTQTTGPTSTPNPTSTPGPTKTPYPTHVPGAILGYHTVQRGETLFCIGRAYGVDPYAVASKNAIVNPSVIWPGQVLAIPDAPAVVAAGWVCPAQFGGGAPPPECRYYHTVAWGENLYRLSMRYGVTMWAIAEANGITDMHYIYAGQVLCIP
jgi:LysM repeat protein